MLTKGLARDIPCGRFDHVVYQEILRSQRQQQRLAPERPARDYSTALPARTYGLTGPGGGDNLPMGLISRVRRNLRR